MEGQEIEPWTVSMLMRLCRKTYPLAYQHHHKPFGTSKQDFTWLLPDTVHRKHFL